MISDFARELGRDEIRRLNASLEVLRAWEGQALQRRADVEYEVDDIALRIKRASERLAQIEKLLDEDAGCAPSLTVKPGKSAPQ